MSEEVANHNSISIEDHQGTISRPSKKSFYGTFMGKMLIKMTYIFPILWCASIITEDPLNHYIYVIDDERKCIKRDSWVDPLFKNLKPVCLAIDVACLCSLAIKGGLLKRNEKLIWLPLLLVDISLFQYIQVKKYVGQVFWPSVDAKNYYAVNFYLMYYFITVILMYTAFTRVAVDRFAKATWAHAAFNLLLYISGGYVYGSLWYNSAIRRNLDCWIEACQITNDDCSTFSDLYCGSGKQYNHTKLDEMCSTSSNTSSSTVIDFGIYKDAIAGGIIQDKYGYSQKVLHCLRWGLQNLSGFGQNLTVSTNTWENAFVMSMTVYGVLLFTFFIGNIQMYLQKTLKLEIRSNKRIEIQKSSIFPKLSKNLQKQIKRYRPDNSMESSYIKFNYLPSDIKKDIKRTICPNILLKVNSFKCWNKEFLDELSDYAKAVLYPEHAQVLKKNERIDKMLFVLHGKLRVYSFMSSDARVEEIEDGELCGEELVDWFETNPYSSSLPISNKTVEATGEVEAFVLMHYDIQTLFIKHQKARES